VKASNKKILSGCFKILGATIKYERQKKKITLEQLGFDIGLDKSAMHRIEVGKPITITTLIKIAAVLSVKPAHLVKDLPILTNQEID
jgi:transcriptional regulator with XRE-family HTH domain